MRFRYTLALPLFAAAATLIAPALAETQTAPRSAPDQGMGMHNGMMSRGTMSRGMTSGGMMNGGCADMMQSMGGNGGPPNSQWRHESPNATPN